MKITQYEAHKNLVRLHGLDKRTLCRILENLEHYEKHKKWLNKHLIRNYMRKLAMHLLDDEEEEEFDGNPVN
jgi:hypothetical protein